MEKLAGLLDQISILLGKVVAPLTAVMVVFSCGVVLIRYYFNDGATALQETVVYLHATVFMLGIAYTLQQSGHVRVDILYQKFSPRTQAGIDLFGTLVFLLPVAGFIFWSSLDYVSFSWRLKESSPEPGGLPYVYLLKTLIPAMSGLLFLQGIAQLFRHLGVLLGAKPNA